MVESTLWNRTALFTRKSGSAGQIGRETVRNCLSSSHKRCLLCAHYTVFYAPVCDRPRHTRSLEPEAFEFWLQFLQFARWFCCDVLKTYSRPCPNMRLSGNYRWGNRRVRPAWGIPTVMLDQDLASRSIMMSWWWSGSRRVTPRGRRSSLMCQMFLTHFFFLCKWCKKCLGGENWNLGLWGWVGGWKVLVTKTDWSIAPTPASN